MRTSYEVRGSQASKCGTGKIVQWSNECETRTELFSEMFFGRYPKIFDYVYNEYHCCDMFRAPVCQFRKFQPIYP